MSQNHQAIAPNAQRLLWAGFTAILAAGVGFGIRGGIFGNWAAEFNFTGLQLGKIGGAGFTGFCFGIIIGGVIVDKIGYGKLVFAAFLFHVLSALITFGAVPGVSPEAAYQFLLWGIFTFALANGTLEAVSNPLVSTLFPHKRNHYLNILHASWPLGLVLGGLIGWTLGSGENAWDWRWQLAFYLLPTLVYGAMFLGQKFPQSEAALKGLKIGEMFKDVGILGGLVVCGLLYLFFEQTFGDIPGIGGIWPTLLSAVIALGLLGVIATITNFSLGSVVLFFLFIAHALIGAVELGTDGWIQNITGVLLTPDQGKLLFVFTSLMMFILRFCTDWIERHLKISPIGLLLICSLFAIVGLNLVAAVSSFGPALGALIVYAIGKTFFWPTMLAVAGDRFPRTGAVAMSLMGGIGMMSAGLIGSAGLGYAKDRFAAKALEAESAELYAEYQLQEGEPSGFLFFGEVTALDPQRLEALRERVTAITAAEARGEVAMKTDEEGNQVPVQPLTAAEESVLAADVTGARNTLRVDSLIPMAMAVIFLGLLFYFKSIGGYRPLRIDEPH
jgi:MFS family permease